MNTLLQFIVDQYQKPMALFSHPLWFAFLGRLRRFLRRRYDGWITCRVGKMSLRMRFSHELYVYKRALPDYGENLGRLAEALNSRIRNFCMVDIGANVGDTVATVRAYAQFPVLCVEADDEYFVQMKRNLAGLADVEFEKALVGAADRLEQGQMVSRGGTAHFAFGSDSGATMSLGLATILQRHPAFATPSLLKIDTDGFDVAIILGAMDVIKEKHPVIYLEYDPATARQAGVDALALFPALEAAGYGKMLVFNNLGEYLLSLEVGDRQQIVDLHCFFSGRKSCSYADIAVFPKELNDACALIREGEIARAQTARNFTIAALP